MFGYLEQKLLGRSRKSLVFLKNKKFWSVKSRFPVHLVYRVIQILDNIGSLPFISWAISMKLSGYRILFSVFASKDLSPKIALTPSLWQILFTFLVNSALVF
jgi:hypothetical protein